MGDYLFHFMIEAGMGALVGKWARKRDGMNENQKNNIFNFNRKLCFTARHR